MLVFFLSRKKKTKDLPKQKIPRQQIRGNGIQVEKSKGWGCEKHPGRGVDDFLFWGG